MKCKRIGNTKTRESVVKTGWFSDRFSYICLTNDKLALKKMKTLLIAILLMLATADRMARADDVNKSMIAIMPVETSEKKSPLAQPTELRAGDWVAAWQAARQACSDAQEVRIYFKDRPTSGMQGVNLFKCMDIKARGQVLVITSRKTDKTEESIILVPATEVLRLELVKKTAP